MTIAEDIQILLMIKINIAKPVSDDYLYSKQLQEMEPNVRKIDAQMERLLLTSRNIRDGWIDTTELIADTIRDRARMEDEARTEGITTESIRAAAINAVRAAKIAEREAIMQGVNHIVATCKGEQAGADAAVASIKDAKAAQNAKMEVAAVAIKTEQDEAEAAGVATKAAITRISMNRASNGAIAVNANVGGTIARAPVGYPLINRNPKLTYPRHMPMWTGVNDPSNSLYGVGVTRSPPPVSYTHLTLPTKRIV